MAKKVINWELNGESQNKQYKTFLLEFVSIDDLKKQLLACIIDIKSSNDINNLLA